MKSNNGKKGAITTPSSYKEKELITFLKRASNGEFININSDVAAPYSRTTVLRQEVYKQDEYYYSLSHI